MSFYSVATVPLRSQCHPYVGSAIKLLIAKSYSQSYLCDVIMITDDTGQHLNLELETIKKCSAKLALALRDIGADFIYFLNNEGFITDDDVNSILNPVSVLTAAQKAQELVRLIKESVELSPESYGVLIAELKHRGRRCKAIVRLLGEEYTKQKQAHGKERNS